MANTLITSTQITRKFYEQFHSTCHVARKLSRQYEANLNGADPRWGRTGATVNIRIPAQFSVRTGWTMSTQDVEETYVPLTINTVRGVDLNFHDSELAMQIDDFTERYISGPAKQLAAIVDAYCTDYMVKRIPNAVGTPGTAPNSASIFMEARQRIAESLAPPGEDIACVISPRTTTAIVPALASQFNPAGNISRMFEDGQMSNALGMKWFESQTLSSHTTGSRTAVTPIVNGASQTGSSVVVSGAGNAVTYTEGDIVTFAGCYDVNRETGQAYSNLKTFRITSTTTSDGAGAITLPISPSIVISGPTKNCSASPTNGGSVGLKGSASSTYSQDLVFHPKAFQLAFAALPEYSGLDMCKTVTADGFSMRYIRDFDAVNAKVVSRMDVWFGIAAVRPEWATRIFG